MPQKPPVFRPPQIPAAQDRQRSYDKARTAEQPWRRWYKLAAWCHPVHGLRAVQLRRQPLCEACLAKAPQELTPATIAHHKRAHRGEWSLFADPDNIGSWCKPCHDSEAQAAERAEARPAVHWSRRGA